MLIFHREAFMNQNFDFVFWFSQLPRYTNLFMEHWEQWKRIADAFILSSFFLGVVCL